MLLATGQSFAVSSASESTMWAASGNTRWLISKHCLQVCTWQGCPAYCWLCIRLCHVQPRLMRGLLSCRIVLVALWKHLANMQSLNVEAGYYFCVRQGGLVAALSWQLSAWSILPSVKWFD